MGYAQVNYYSQSGTFTPFGSGDKCGAACRAIVAAKDSVFTAYPRDRRIAR